MPFITGNGVLRLFSLKIAAILWRNDTVIPKFSQRMLNIIDTFFFHSESSAWFCFDKQVCPTIHKREIFLKLKGMSPVRYGTHSRI